MLSWSIKITRRYPSFKSLLCSLKFAHESIKRVANNPIIIPRLVTRHQKSLHTYPVIEESKRLWGKMPSLAKERLAWEHGH